MSWTASLTTAQIQTIFEEEVKLAGGKVTDTFDDGTLLFTRAVLPKNEKVKCAVVASEFLAAALAGAASDGPGGQAKKARTPGDESRSPGGA